MLEATIAPLPEAFICIDGLDECLPKIDESFLSRYGTLYRLRRPRGWFFVGDLTFGMRLKDVSPRRS